MKVCDLWIVYQSVPSSIIISCSFGLLFLFPFFRKISDQKLNWSFSSFILVILTKKSRSIFWCVLTFYFLFSEKSQTRKQIEVWVLLQVVLTKFGKYNYCKNTTRKKFGRKVAILLFEFVKIHSNWIDVLLWETFCVKTWDWLGTLTWSSHYVEVNRY